MNILFIEDNCEISELKKEHFPGCQVTVAYTLFSARFCLEKDPGADAFDAIIFDVNMPFEDLPQDLQDMLTEDEKELPGYVFYEKILKVKYPKLYKNTIFYTGFVKRLKEKVGEDRFKTLRIVSKDNNRTSKDISEYLRKM